ncbi:hypothetical protein V8G54_035206 [Vigna mungo]|uniref:Uncharacterized protein n=1 Tax=Vigna mungo TaxID=3915 RepID=A0AAQ3MEM3_VIGMU
MFTRFDKRKLVLSGEVALTQSSYTKHHQRLLLLHYKETSLVLDKDCSIWPNYSQANILLEQPCNTILYWSNLSMSSCTNPTILMSFCLQQLCINGYSVILLYLVHSCSCHEKRVGINIYSYFWCYLAIHTTLLCKF